MIKKGQFKKEKPMFAASYFQFALYFGLGARAFQKNIVEA